MVIGKACFVIKHLFPIFFLHLTISGTFQVLFGAAKMKQLQGLENNQPQVLRCWSCGCSTGEEVKVSHDFSSFFLFVPFNHQVNP